MVARIWDPRWLTIFAVIRTIPITASCLNYDILAVILTKHHLLFVLKKIIISRCYSLSTKLEKLGQLHITQELSEYQQRGISLPHLMGRTTHGMALENVTEASL